jgi:hypothetical protein
MRRDASKQFKDIIDQSILETVPNPDAKNAIRRGTSHLDGSQYPAIGSKAWGAINWPIVSAHSFASVQKSG